MDFNSNRIYRLFSGKKGDILNIYFTAGFPGLEDTLEIVPALEAAGADLIEIGMPYSDPLADGPTIQQSGQTALRNGMTLPMLFEQIEVIRPKVSIPLVLMGYFNQVMQYGESAFFRKCAEVGVDGLIIPDLPLFEYRSYYKAEIEALGLGFSFLITPQTAPERIKLVDELSRGFIYMVSNAAITGAKQDITAEQIAYFERIKAMGLANPRLIGFGISNFKTFSTACKYADGAIIGSAFIKALERGGDLRSTIMEFMASIRGEGGSPGRPTGMENTPIDSLKNG